MDNFFSSFYLLTHLEGNNIRATGVHKCTIKGDKQLQKKECGHFEQRRAHQAERECNLCDWLKRQQGDLHSFF